MKALALTVKKLLTRLKFHFKEEDRMPELQNDKMTDRIKIVCPPIFDLGGIKISTNLKKIIITVCHKISSKVNYQDRITSISFQ